MTYGLAAEESTRMSKDTPDEVGVEYMKDVHNHIASAPTL